MNSFLLQLVGKWITLLIISCGSLFGYNLKEAEIIANNSSADKNTNIVYDIIKHETIVKKTTNLPNKTTKIIVDGIDGLIYIDPLTKERKTAREVVNKVIEEGTGPSHYYNGKLTGYGADCKGCSGTVACQIPIGKKHNLVKDGIHYNDEQYGELRILAASHKVFPCGSIIKVTKKGEKPFIGIVLDTGSAMRKAWNETKEIVLDLAFLSENDPMVLKTTSNNVTFDLIRYGW